MIEKIDFSLENNLSEFSKLVKNKNHRYASWEHCYKCFNKNVIGKGKLDEKTIDHAALMLGFYLASWGMYRGSTKLLQEYTYTIHKDAINIIKNKNDLEGAAEAIKKYYKSKGVSATETLITKILLGTLGICPAYDRFFKSGISAFKKKFGKIEKNNKEFRKISGSFSAGSFGALKKAFEDNILKNDELNTYDKVRSKFELDNCYTSEKIIDMYFWSLGQQYEKDKNNKEAIS